MISIKNILGLFLVIIIITSCSLNKNSSFWTKKKIVKKEQAKNVTELFVTQEKIIKEFNPNLKIKLSSTPKNTNIINNLNNSGRINYDGELKKISRYKYSKINKFDIYEPDLIFDKSNVIFFDDKGSILKFDHLSKLVWKKNHYTKKEKKKKPFLFFANNSRNLIVADTISQFYSINIKTGDLLWKKINDTPFNSEIKIYKDNFYLVDLENILRSFSIKDGKEIWKFKTQKSIIKSQKKLSIIIVDDKVFFTNSVGDVTALEANTGNLIWQTPTQRTSVEAGYFKLKTSDLISDAKSILFSNNNNNFFSLDVNTGLVNWIQKINSTIRPSLIDGYVFTVTEEGFLVIIDRNKGNIIKMTDVFNVFNVKKRSKIKPEGFVVGKKNIYLTTNNGLLLIIDLSSGMTKEVIKVDREKISRPFILDQNLFIAKNNAIIKLN